MDRRTFIGAVSTTSIGSLISGCTSSPVDADIGTTTSETAPDGGTNTPLPIVIDVLGVTGAIEDGQPTVTYAIANHSNESIYVPITVSVDGSTIDDADVFIPGNGIKTFTATWFSDTDASQQPTRLTVSGGGVTTTHQVTYDAPIAPSISDIKWVDKTHVMVTYGATNNGTTRDSTTLRLRRNQVLTSIHEVTLDPGESVTFMDTVRVGDNAARITVVTDVSMAKQLITRCE